MSRVTVLRKRVHLRRSVKRDATASFVPGGDCTAVGAPSAVAPPRASDGLGVRRGQGARDVQDAVVT